MGISQAISAAVTAAFKSIADLLQPAVYKRDKSDGTTKYDTATGLVTESWTKATISGVLYDYKSNQIDNVSIFLTDKQFLFRADSISFDPSLNDEIELDGQAWQVVGKTKDPTGCVWILHLRKP